MTIARKSGAWLRVASVMSVMTFVAPTASLALSEIKPDGSGPAAEAAPVAPSDTIQSAPLPPPAGATAPEPAPAVPAEPAPGDTPAPVTPPTDPTDAEGQPAEDGEGVQTTRPQIDPDQPIPDVVYDTALLPEPVRRMRELLLEATRSGDPERLRPLLGMGDSATQLSFGGVEGDLIEFLKQSSGDGQGHEMMAILEEVLEAGYVHVDEGKPEELYVWPYFFAVPLDRLTARQRVELFRIVTAGDYEDMKAYGAYIFYRVGIAPDGRWSFFVAGD